MSKLQNFISRYLQLNFLCGLVTYIRFFPMSLSRPELDGAHTKYPIMSNGAVCGSLCSRDFRFELFCDIMSHNISSLHPWWQCQVATRLLTVLKVYNLFWKMQRLCFHQLKVLNELNWICIILYAICFYVAREKEEHFVLVVM